VKRAMTILKKELKDSIRDRRTLVVMVLVPILLMPLVLVGSIKLQEWSAHSAASSVAHVMVSGAENAPALARELDDAKLVEVVKKGGDPVDLLKQGEIDAYLVIPQGFEQGVAAGGQVSLVLKINSTKDNSSGAADKVRPVVNEYSNRVIARRLESLGASTAVLNRVEVQAEDTATKKETGGKFLGFLLPMFLVLFSILGGMYTAIDISAGEKERKSLEALLMTPASRSEIVIGKFLTVATVSVTSVALSLVSIFVTAQFIARSMKAVEVSLDWQVALLLVPISLLLAGMFAALLLAICIFARSYKEAMNYITPLYLLVIMPILFANTVATENPPAILFAIPGFNAVLLFREVLVGDYVPLHIFLTVVSLLFFAGLSIYYAIRNFSREDVLVDEGGPDRGRRKRPGLLGARKRS
jgi:sodium transport system permease protein